MVNCLIPILNDYVILSSSLNNSQELHSCTRCQGRFSILNLGTEHGNTITVPFLHYARRDRWRQVPALKYSVKIIARALVTNSNIKLTMKNLELELRSLQIKLLLSDCDGVLTDGGVYYSDSGEAMKRFSIRDGMAVSLLRNAGIETGIISSETSESLRRRAEKLRISQVHLGISDKVQRVRYLAQLSGLSLSQIAFIGNDTNDLELMHLLNDLSIVAAPADAMRAVRQASHYVCSVDGGRGAFREFADWLLNLRGSAISGRHNVESANHSIIRILALNGSL